MGAPPENGVSGPKLKEFPPGWVGDGLARGISSLPGLAWLVGGAACGRLVVHVLDKYPAETIPQLLTTQAAGLIPRTCQEPWAIAAAAIAFVLIVLLVARSRRQHVYLVDFACYRPAEDLKVTYNRFMQGSKDSGYFNDEAIDFQRRILEKSALSQETFFPRGLHAEPPVVTMETAMQEADEGMCQCVQDALTRTGLKPKQIDILVTNCSLFNPTPSLAAMIINRFGMRSDVDSYNLAGMGCSAGVLSIGLASKLLKERGRGGYALVVSTENITQNWYRGLERSMLIPNTIFRLGAAAIVLSNKRSERRRAKYELEHVLRVHLGADEAAYRCIFQEPDSQGRMGVALSKDIVKVAAKALTLNLTRLGPLVLPWSEKLMFAANFVARKCGGQKTIAPYIPDFTKAFAHFCLHAGGRGVVEGLSKQLGLSPTQMEPSANTLYWYGNTSSSTIWYSFAFCEYVPGVKKGDRVWQIAFGSGFKCNSAVWRALRPIHDSTHAAWKHIDGRENEAMDALRRIAAASEREREEKRRAEQKATNGQAPRANGRATQTPFTKANGTVETRLTRSRAQKST